MQETGLPTIAPRALLRRVNDVTWEIPADARDDMRVPARFFADDALAAQIGRDHSLDQLVNVTTLPGIVGAAFGMPDMHEGYGFPVGGVAATEAPDGVISPGGIGFDINCGVRLLVSNFDANDVHELVEPLVQELARAVPAGFGRHGHKDALDHAALQNVLAHGVPWLVRERGLGTEDDVAHIESNGCLPGADAGQVSVRAHDRGQDQLGTLGGGNHFLEIDVVDAIYDENAANRLGLHAGGMTLLVHTGSRGLGHQVCTDNVRAMDAAMSRHGIHVPDRQLACAPLSSPEGRRYFAAMAAAANFGFCNRQVISHRARAAFARILGENATLRLVYDVAHNTAKLERHGGRIVCVHRKGATRAFGPSSDAIPEDYRGVGQPVLIPGSMGTASWVLVGTDAADGLSFGSACHGAGRAMSRSAAKHQVQGHVLRKELEGRGIVVRCASNAELAEEAPLAYKDVDRVVETVEKAGISRKVARLRPLGVVKG